MVSAGALTIVCPLSPSQERFRLVRRILENRELTLAQLGRESRARYRDSKYHVSHRFYSDLRITGFTPNIQQILALSSVTGYRVVDWLAVFGFHLDAIGRLQATLPTKRTHLIDSTLYDDQEWIPWFVDAESTQAPHEIVPLGRLLSPGILQRAAALTPVHKSPFLYAKVGWQDAFAFPDLLPGSIIRVDTRKKNPASMLKDDRQPIALIQHARGFSFCEMRSARPGHITLRSSELPYPQIELQLEREARVLGTADLELRVLVSWREPVGAAQLSLPPSGIPLLERPASQGLGQLLNTGRSKSGLSFREASKLSRQIAAELGDSRYFCSPGALSNYEVQCEAPRHVHKLITLAVLYSVSFWELARASGLKLADTGKEPLPEIVFSTGARAPGKEVSDPPLAESFVGGLLHDFEEIPLFLREALPTLLELRTVSLRDVYWMGGNRFSLHPQLNSTVLAAVDRRRKRPADVPGKTLNDQPLYMLLARERGYLAAACHQEGDFLIAHPFSDGFRSPQRFRQGIDAEVVGRIVALLRRVR
jgi:hypothetical protein